MRGLEHQLHKPSRLGYCPECGETAPDPSNAEPPEGIKNLRNYLGLPQCSESAYLVVNNTQQVRASNSVRWRECRRKIICWTTPVIRAIIVWTVSSVKLLNNVVVGNGEIL